VLLKDKVIVIIGGAGLLGREFVSAVVNNGGVAIIADLKEVSFQEFDINHKQVKFVKTDFTRLEQIENLINIVSKEYGRIDCLVNSAYPRNQNYGRDFLEVTFEDFCENACLHLGGYFLSCQCFIKFFINQGYGNIVNIASIYGVVAPRFDLYTGTTMTMPIEYAVIKSGIIHMTKYLAKYLKGKNIRVNCISPGGILDKQPEKFLKRYRDYCLNKGMLSKSDINGTLVFLLSDMSEFINGQNIIVDDGFTL
jgi:NAD(P)-dependent dehydrogenase (short-subunit alcohol dehydrogenase family)